MMQTLAARIPECGAFAAIAQDVDWAVKTLRTALEQPEQEPTCPECKAGVLYECVACSSNNYPPKPEQEPVAWAVQGCSKMWRGEMAEIDAKAEAKRIGGTCVAYALYTTPPAAPPARQSYVDGLQDAIALLQDCKENSIDWLIDRLSDYKLSAERTVPAAQRPWQGLTHQQTKDCVQGWDGNDAYVLCRAIEAKLKEKNT
jgi:hypothetical protein